MFYEKFGDMMTLPEHEELCLVVTTNGFVTSKGKAVMGRGIAKQIADSKGIKVMNLARIEDLNWAIQLINS